ncbi:MAG: hypothetical protein U0800_01505 [Isosphaeraceae bacterium]
MLTGDRSQVLGHDFELVNRGDRPMQIVHATAQMPCCSALGDVPASIAPGSSASIHATFRPGVGDGRRRVGFEVVTRSDAARVHRFALEATLVPEWELRGREGVATVVTVNRPNRSEIEVVCRRFRGEGRDLPEVVEAEPPVRAAFEGPSTERRLDEGLVERSRTLVIDWPPTTIPGREYGRLRLDWTDGRSSEHALSRTVVPRIDFSPSAFIWREGAPTAGGVLLLRAEEPFRILGVEGPVEVVRSSPEDGPSTSHRVELAFRPDPGRLPSTATIAVSTDDEDQPQVRVPLLILPDAREVGP